MKKILFHITCIILVFIFSPALFSQQAEPEEPDTRQGTSLRRRLIMAIALLAGLIFVAAIETDIGDRLTGVIFPAPVKISNPTSTAVNGPEEK